MHSYINTINILLITYISYMSGEYDRFTLLIPQSSLALVQFLIPIPFPLAILISGVLFTKGIRATLILILDLLLAKMYRWSVSDSDWHLQEFDTNCQITKNIPDLRSVYVKCQLHSAALGLLYVMSVQFKMNFFGIYKCKFNLTLMYYAQSVSNFPRYCSLQRGWQLKEFDTYPQKIVAY